MKFVVPKISAEEAREILGKRGRFSLRRKGEMKKMEVIYLPYYVHRAVVWQGDHEYEVVACTDGICCGFSFFEAKQTAFCDAASGEVFDFLVSPEEAERACLENLRWHLLRQGLRLKVRASVKEIREVERIHYPYWIAYFKTADGYDFRAADAVTGEIRWVRMRRAFLTAFSQAGATDGGVSAASDSAQRTRRARRR